MNLYTKWTDFVLDYVKTKGEAAFWNEYKIVEQKIYKEVLSDTKIVFEGTFENLKNRFDVSEEFFMGFLDGINESLEEEADLEKIESNSRVRLNINFEKLYFNMLDSKADYLYTLPQWNSILSAAKRKEIIKEWRKSKTVINETKVGRNDTCTCGSGKKYKKCCGKDA